MTRTLITLSMVCMSLLVKFSSFAEIIHVPQDYATVQGGINAASDSDTVLVQPGTYVESLAINGTSFTLASLFLTTRDTNYIASTTLDGGGAGAVLRISNTDPSMIVTGFTIRSGEDGIRPYSKLQLLHCRITDCTDGVDYESGSGGRIAYCVFEDNSDDGIDLDQDAPTLVEHCIIRNNNDDGIEIRFHPYSGPTLEYVIRWNVIYGNGEDGIQLIDYSDASNRNIVIERNLIHSNAMAGLGIMDNGDTREDYRGAIIPEPILLANNTFDDHNHGVTGGGNMTFINNIVSNSTVLGLKNVTGGSTLVSYSCLWQNGTNFANCNTDAGTLVFDDPLFTPDYTLQNNSPCIDAGSVSCTDPDTTICDIGVFYFDQSPLSINEGNISTTIPDGYALHINYPNPFNPQTTIGFSLPQLSHVMLSIYDLSGRMVKSLINGEFWRAGSYSVVWDGTDDRGSKLSSGAYLCRIETKGFDASRKMILLR